MSTQELKNKKQAIQELLKSKIKSRDDLMAVKRKLAKKYNIDIPRNSEILKELNFVETHCNASLLRRILRKRAVRTMSGIAPVAVLTKPFVCPGKCVYCPTEKDVPQSYLSNEPAVMRAIRCNYDPYLQVQHRLKALEANGHEPTKIELIVIGGTWSVLPNKYKYWYILNCFVAANQFGSKVKNQELKIKASSNINELKKELLNQQKKNEKAKYKIVGITLETRPDYINEKEIKQMRRFGCTRVEIGVQIIDDNILKLNKRGHGVKEIESATELLRDYGFKITYHIMPGLPGSTPAKDFKMFKQLFSDKRFQPDQIKFYPTVVTKGSLLHKWWLTGKYKPYSDKILRDLIIKCKEVVPPYTRIIRLIRDIPKESIIAGNKITNLRQIMLKQGVKCDCIRCREARGLKIKNFELRIISYKILKGVEYFISFENIQDKILYGFCRLYVPLRNTRQARNKIKALNNAAIIRELHIYGELVPVGKNKKIQHAGLGKKLMAEAEKIACQNKFKKIAVISGIGVRGYYRKLGYRLKSTYMIKIL